MKNKSLFELLFGDWFKMPDIEELFSNEALTKEEQTFTKGNYKTTITSYFTKDGRLMGNKSTTVVIPNEQEQQINYLQTQLDEAVENQEFLLAADLKKQIVELQTPNKKLTQ